MNWQFENNLSHQTAAIDAVVSLFKGQEITQGRGTLPRLQDILFDEVGTKNRLVLPDEVILENMREVQAKNGLAPSSLKTYDFSIEMETGTGKTYVYLRSLFELNAAYGFSKFIILVPSVAIREGVLKTIQITTDHFKNEYEGASLNAFTYDSGDLSRVKSFAQNDGIEVMIMTIAAMNKFDSNKIFEKHEKFEGASAFDFIIFTRPIVIMDEPQSLEGSKGKLALEKLKPLFTLRYSATHKVEHNLIYRLDAIDAYEKKLVKQIEVAGATIENASNRPFVKLLKIDKKYNVTLELDYGVNGKRQGKAYPHGSWGDLYEETKRELYQNMRVSNIEADRVCISSPDGETWLNVGEEMNSVDKASFHREMIRKTIRIHLEREKVLLPLGIKVLTLFFIDDVPKYRIYNEQGRVKGEYALIFEEEYAKASRDPRFASVFLDKSLAFSPQEVHDGYFSIDKKFVSPFEEKELKGNKDGQDKDTFSLIMKDKERLLDMKTPLKFIFSHSALREGWDNPNVFQICNFQETDKVNRLRQTIGRGLRLCVDKSFNRVHDEGINTLTIISHDSYEIFAENLQKELLEDGFEFGVIKAETFSNISFEQPDGTPAIFGFAESQTLFTHFATQGYMDSKGKVTDILRQALKDGKVNIPDNFAPMKHLIIEKLRKTTGKLDIKNHDKKNEVGLNKEVLLSEDFQNLWERIKHKTTYQLDFDSEKLIELCADKLRAYPPMPKPRVSWATAEQNFTRGGVIAKEKNNSRESATILDDIYLLPPLLDILEEQTKLTKRSLCAILEQSGRLNDFSVNPQKFIDNAKEAILYAKKELLSDGVKYEKLEGEFYEQSLFNGKELLAYFEGLEPVKKSVYNYNAYDSKVESEFADELENQEMVKVYAKLPRAFVINTPLGTYNPDWAVVIEQNGEQKLYFVVETKSSTLEFDLRLSEKNKISFGEKHFTALNSGVTYFKDTSFKGVLSRL